MKQLYWIDDSFSYMFPVVQGAIKKLWGLSEESEENKVCSNIIIFGDADQEWEGGALPTQEEEEEEYHHLEKVFWECCFALDGPNENRPVFMANRGLIKECISHLLKNKNEDDKNIFAEIKKIWGSRDRFEEDKAKVVEKLIDRMELVQGAVIGIDIVLLYEDYERIMEGCDVISMELYNQLTRQYKCFLYSSDAGDVEFAEAWKKIYRDKYNVGNDSEKDLPIEIYEREDFYEKGSERVVAKVRQLLRNT